LRLYNIIMRTVENFSVCPSHYRSHSFWFVMVGGGVEGELPIKSSRRWRNLRIFCKSGRRVTAVKPYTVTRFPLTSYCCSSNATNRLPHHPTTLNIHCPPAPPRAFRVLPIHGVHYDTIAVVIVSFELENGVPRDCRLMTRSCDVLRVWRHMWTHAHDITILLKVRTIRTFRLIFPCSY